jgi:hypothetical protein
MMKTPTIELVHLAGRHTRGRRERASVPPSQATVPPRLSGPQRSYGTGQLSWSVCSWPEPTGPWLEETTFRSRQTAVIGTALSASGQKSYPLSRTKDPGTAPIGGFISAGRKPHHLFQPPTITRT